MRVRFVAGIALLLLAVSASAAPPTAEQILQKMIDATGGEQAFRQLGLIKLRFGDVETTADGTSQSTRATAYVPTFELDSFRLEMPGDLLLVRSGDSGWAKIRGKLDTRPQTPDMAKGTVHQRLVPFLLPHTLTMSGVSITDVAATDFDGTPAWRLKVVFDRNFFASPVMNTPWAVYVAREDATVLAAEFRPTQEYKEVQDEGVRYRYSKWTTVNGVQLPTQVVMFGVFPNGLETGHNRIVNITPEVADWDATLFVNPEALKAFDEADPLAAEPE